MTLMPISVTSADPASPLREDALDWFVRRGNPAFTADDEAMFQAWLNADPAHIEAFALWQGQSGEIDAIPAELRQLLQRNLALDTALDAASTRGAGRIASPPPPPQAAPARPVRRRALLVGAYAGLAMASGWLGWRQWQSQPRYSQRFETQRGEQSEVVLPDGTVMQLDTQTQLEVVYYHQRRTLQLIDGQVLLAVSKDATRPFQVLSGPLQVTVVGTRFSVRHTPQQADADGVDVQVSEGRVRVEAIGQSASSAAGHALYLSAGDQVHSDGEGRLDAVSQISPEQVGAWQQYRVRFINRRLDQVLAELSRYRDLPLVINDPAVAALHVTGVFDPRDLVTFQHMLPLSLPVRLADLGDGRREVRLRH